MSQDVAERFSGVTIRVLLNKLLRGWPTGPPGSRHRPYLAALLISRSGRDPARVILDTELILRDSG
jgi:hypothetical protein